MKMKKALVFLVVAFLSVGGVSKAGLHGLTHHSRANCGNNETISWHKGHKYWF